MKKASNLIFVTGIAFICIGLFNALSPEAAAGFLNMPLSTVRLISGVLAFLGLSDIFIAKFVLQKKEVL